MIVTGKNDQKDILISSFGVVLIRCRRMSKSKKKQAPLPASSAGLLRFFEDETKGVKIRPEIVVAMSVALIVISILIRILLPV